MEKKGNNVTAASDSDGVCEEIFSAITASPAFQTIRRITHFPEDSSASASASPATSDPSKLRSPANDHLQNKPRSPPKKSAALEPVVISIPIKSGKTVPPAAANHPIVQARNRTKVTKIVGQGNPGPKAEALTQPQKIAAKIEPEKTKLTHVSVLQEKHKGKEDSDFAQTGDKHKPKSPLKLEAQVKINEGNKKPGGKWDINDTFSEYINRAKTKIRASSFKKESESDEGEKERGKDHHFSDYIHRTKNKFKSTPSNVGAEERVGG